MVIVKHKILEPRLCLFVATARVVALILCVTGFFTLAFNVHAQERSKNIFDPVPLDLRPRLFERLKEYVAYERTREYEKLYELLYDCSDKEPDKRTYSTSRLKIESRWGVVQEFTPIFVMDITFRPGDPPTFKLMGRARVFRNGRMVHKEMSMDARLQDGEWYFTELSDSFLHVD